MNSEHQSVGDEMRAGRLEKLAALEASGVDPYPPRFERDSLAAELHDQFGDLDPEAFTGQVVTVAGRVVLFRSFGSLVFATLQDASGRIQLLADKEALGADVFDAFADLDPGDWIGASGEVMTTRRGELTVKVTSHTLLSKAVRPLPEKWHGLKDVEQRSRHREVDLIMSADARNIAAARSQIVAELRSQFAKRGFVEVETPILQIQAGGALARPFVTHHEALDIPMYLRIATELHLKRMIVGGTEKVFELGRIFRNEGIDSTHSPEFTTLEAYQALADYGDIMELMEEVIPAVAEAVTGGTTITYQDTEIDLKGPYRRVPICDLVSEAVGEPVEPTTELATMRGIAERHGLTPDEGWGSGKIIEKLFDSLVEPTLIEPTFVIDHPKEISPLARTHRDDPELVERFELYIAGAEYCDAFSELNDPREQRNRFKSQAADKTEAGEPSHPIDEEFLAALEYGMPPTGGLGIGVDRLVMLLTDQTHVREVLLFPTLKPE